MLEYWRVCCHDVFSGPVEVWIVEVKESWRWARTWYVSVVFVLLGALVVMEVMKN